MAVEVGSEAPDFTLKDENGKDVSLSDLRGRNVVLMFYPLAFSGVCTKELHDISSAPGRYQAANAEVLRAMRSQHQHALAKLLVARARAYQRLHFLSEINRMRAEGAALPRLLGTVMQHPSIWPRLVRHALRAARYRYRDGDPALQASLPPALRR